jgi:restriction endonuclease S subunit
MYISIITLKDALTQEQIKHVHELCKSAYNNKFGKLDNVSTDPMVIRHEDPNPYGCVSEGDCIIYENGTAQFFKSWYVIDEDDGGELEDLFVTFKQCYPELQGSVYGKQ